MADQGTEGLLSPYLRARRINAVKPHLRGKVLDFGCGSGALAMELKPGDYVGFDIDEESLNEAKSGFPEHQFVGSLSGLADEFDTVVSLAVVEHVEDPVAFLEKLSSFLKNSESSRIVLTTPHPSVDWVHDLGAKVGLFSRHANEEHEELLDKAMLDDAGKKAGLDLILYQKFLFWANQLAVFSR
jgi:2-polyprenyl-3-methyl-5-hydroxy-6-metoxy-1,4-benzoquinol methylase